MDGKQSWRWWGCRGGGWVIALMVALPGTAAPAGAQTRFKQDTVLPDVGRYTVMEECIAAANWIYGRYWREAMGRQSTTEQADTMPPGSWHQPPPAPEILAAAVATDRRCLPGLTPTDTMLNSFGFAFAMSYFLVAERDADAATVLARRLAAVPATDTATMIAIKDSALQVYLRAKPHPRLAEAERLYMEQMEREHLVGRRRLERLWVWARDKGDTVQANALDRQLHAGSWIDTVKAGYEAEFPTSSRATADSALRQYFADGMLSDLEKVYRDSLLDTLKLGTLRWREARRALMIRASPELAALVHFDSLTGKPAPAISGDFWFGYDASAGPRPTRGKVGLVVFVEGTGSPGEKPAVDGYTANRRKCLSPIADRREVVVENRCGWFLAPVRRLMRRFPALEVTLVAATTGSVLYRGLPDSAVVEAEMIRQLLVDGYRLQGAALAVVQSKFFRLPAPDRRLIRVRSSDRNVAEYEQLGGAKGSAGPGMAYLIDREGLVVDAMSLDESQFVGLIDAVLKQPARHP